MSNNDSRRVTQIHSLDIKNLNEALRQLNEAITQLEGRKGQIQLRDGLHSTTSNQIAAQFDAQELNSADFGIYFAGVDGTDVWLAAGAVLAPTAEWIATKTRAVLFKFDNILGGQTYFNTGLTVGASFIPTLQTSSLSAPVWGSWNTNTDEGVISGIGELYAWDHEIHTDSSYFLRQSSNTEVKILQNGYYEILTFPGFALSNFTFAITDLLFTGELLLNAGLFPNTDPGLSTFSLSDASATLIPTWTFTAPPIHIIAPLVANDLVSVKGTLTFPGGGSGFLSTNSKLTIKLLRT